MSTLTAGLAASPLGNSISLKNYLLYRHIFLYLFNLTASLSIIITKRKCSYIIPTEINNEVPQKLIFNKWVFDCNLKQNMLYFLLLENSQTRWKSPPLRQFSFQIQISQRLVAKIKILWQRAFDTETIKLPLQWRSGVAEWNLTPES